MAVRRQRAGVAAETGCFKGSFDVESVLPGMRQLFGVPFQEFALLHAARVVHLRALCDDLGEFPEGVGIGWVLPTPLMNMLSQSITYAIEKDSCCLRTGRVASSLCLW